MDEDKLRKPLEDLDAIEGVRGAAAIRRDGLLIVSNLEDETDVDELAAMTASTVGSGETASATLGIGDVSEVIIEAEAGKLIATGAGEEAILTVLADADVNKGLVLTEMKRAATTIRDEL